MEKKIKPNGIPKILPESGKIKGGQVKPTAPNIDKTFIAKPPTLGPKK